jgi:hypothetical protein
MITNDLEQKAITLVLTEISNIYKLHNKVFFTASRDERDMAVEIFQAGVGIMDKIKKEFIDEEIEKLKIK